MVRAAVGRQALFSQTQGDLRQGNKATGRTTNQKTEKKVSPKAGNNKAVLGITQKTEKKIGLKPAVLGIKQKPEQAVGIKSAKNTAVFGIARKKEDGLALGRSRKAAAFSINKKDDKPPVLAIDRKANQEKLSKTYALGITAKKPVGLGFPQPDPNENSIKKRENGTGIGIESKVKDGLTQPLGQLEEELDALSDQTLGLELDAHFDAGQGTRETFDFLA